MRAKMKSFLASWASAIRQYEAARLAWEIETTRTLLARRKACLFLMVLPILLNVFARSAGRTAGLSGKNTLVAAQAVWAADVLPEKIPILGGSKAYMPSFVNDQMFFGSILVGFIAGLVTGVIGAGPVA